MTIIRKDHIRPFLKELDRYYQELRAAVEGLPPSANSSGDYHCAPDQFARDFADIDMDRVADYLLHFKISVDGLKRLKKYAAKPVGR